MDFSIRLTYFVYSFDSALIIINLFFHSLVISMHLDPVYFQIILFLLILYFDCLFSHIISLVSFIFICFYLITILLSIKNSSQILQFTLSFAYFEIVFMLIF